MHIMKQLKKKIQAGETVIGCWLNLGSPITAEIVGLSGFDWALIDVEHGAGNEKDVLSQLQALAHTPAAALVRIESEARQRIHRILDMGAEGIMCPRVDTVEAAEAVASGLKYPPEGTRGIAKMVRATGFGKDFNDYYANAKDNILGIVQIESKEALDHLDAIAAIDGIDVLFIGPADLTMALGIFGQFDHPLFLDAVKATVAAASKTGKATGILIFNPEEFKKYHAMGLRVIACGADGSFLVEAAKNTADKLKGFRQLL